MLILVLSPGDPGSRKSPRAPLHWHLLPIPSHHFIITNKHKLEQGIQPECPWVQFQRERVY